MWRWLAVVRHGCRRAGRPVFVVAAALALFVLGIGIYASLIRHVIRGPMLSQILSTFGLALLLRYSAFYIFSANFVTLPPNALSGTINIGGVFLPLAQLVAGAGRDRDPDASRCIFCLRAPRSARTLSRRCGRGSLGGDADGHPA